jgi:hypothetical protein
MRDTIVKKVEMRGLLEKKIKSRFERECMKGEVAHSAGRIIPVEGKEMVRNDVERGGGGRRRRRRGGGGGGGKRDWK